MVYANNYTILFYQCYTSKSTVELSKVQYVSQLYTCDRLNIQGSTEFSAHFRYRLCVPLTLTSSIINMYCTLCTYLYMLQRKKNRKNFCNFNVCSAPLCHRIAICRFSFRPIITILYSTMYKSLVDCARSCALVLQKSGCRFILLLIFFFF